VWLLSVLRKGGHPVTDACGHFPVDSRGNSRAVPAVKSLLLLLRCRPQERVAVHDGFGALGQRVMIGPTAQYATNHRHGRTGGRGSSGAGRGTGKPKETKKKPARNRTGLAFFVVGRAEAAPQDQARTHERAVRSAHSSAVDNARTENTVELQQQRQRRRNHERQTTTSSTATTKPTLQQHLQQQRQPQQHNTVDSKRRQRQRERDGQRSRERQSKNIVEQRRTSNID